MPHAVKNVTATTAGIVAVNGDPRRTSLSFFNYQTTRVSVVNTKDQAEAEGFPIAPNSGSLVFNRTNGGDPTKPYSIKSASGSIQIQVIEEWA